MTSARAPLPDIPKGHVFPPLMFSLDEAAVNAYIDATADGNTCYRELDLAPSLAIAALALGTLLEQIELPAGALHTAQEIEMRRAVSLNASLRLSAKLAQRSERAGFVISVLAFEIALEESGTLALSGRTTVMAPASSP